MTDNQGIYACSNVQKMFQKKNKGTRWKEMEDRKKDSNQTCRN